MYWMLCCDEGTTGPADTFCGFDVLPAGAAAVPPRQPAQPGSLPPWHFLCFMSHIASYDCIRPSYSTVQYSTSHLKVNT